MNTMRKFWIVLIGAVLAMALIACSCGSILPALQSTPTSVPPRATTVQEPDPSMAGYWLDTETYDVHTIEWQNGKYVVTSSQSASDTLTVTSQSWKNGMLIWTYSVKSTGASVTFTTTTLSVGTDTLETTWSNAEGNSGSETLQRVSSPVPPQASPTMPPATTSGMAGRWNDPDTTGTITTIIAMDGGYAVESVINPNRGGNELTKTNWSNGVLTWTYCIPGGNCLTSVTISVDGDFLNTTWIDDQGNSGTTVFERVP